MYVLTAGITKLYIILKQQLIIIIYTSIFIFLCIAFICINRMNNYNIPFIILFILIYFELLLIGSIIFVLFYKIKSLIKRHRIKKKKFHKQIIMLFSLATIIPTLFVFVFSVLFFNLGLESLFKTPIKNVMDNNNELINICLQDLHLALKSYVNVLTPTICDCINNNIDIKRMNEILNNESLSNKIDAIVFQLYNNNINILAKSSFALSIQYIIPNKTLYGIPIGSIISYEANGFVVALQKINEPANIFLLIASPIDQKILDYRSKIKQASDQYTILINKHYGLKVNFLMLFCIITLLLLLLAIFSGLVIAHNVLEPVNKLIVAVNNIKNGNYNAPIALKKMNNEWDELLVTFNNMEEQLEHQKQQIIIYNKQIAWRDLARKIAHEVKNPLTPILLSAERIKNKYRKEITTSPEIFDMCINTITRQVNCISCLIKEFSDFARMPAPVMETNNLINLLQEVIFLQSNSHPNIEFKSNFNINNLTCKFDSTQLNQVLINIIQNAINAIVEDNNTNYILSGHSNNTNDNKQENNDINKIKSDINESGHNNIENLDNISNNNTEHYNVMNNKSESIGIILVQCYLNNNNIFIVIEDSGPGFTETAMKKAFEPYFTTRRAGNGLGLAIVYKIINDHGGEITINKSEILRGAKVTINLPYVK